MFGGPESPPKEKVDSYTSSSSSSGADALTDGGSSVRQKESKNAASAASSPTKSSTRGGSEKDKGNQAGDKKRRPSPVNKAAAFFANAKNSLNLSGLRDSLKETHSAQQSSLQTLGKMDPALAVPQGPLNNSAGESLPTPKSTFRVGVTEDRNKKCRRTMEDTHAYLYNFLGTPVSRDAASSETSASENAESGEHATQVIETDNGYFSIFDGHAGTFAAEWCGKKLHLILEELIRKNPNTPIPELLDQTFTSVDQQLEKLPLKNSGCTAVTAVLRWEDRPNPPPAWSGGAANAETSSSPQKGQESSSPAPGSTRVRVLYTANVGDARIILCRNRKALRLSYDHKGSDENEGRRITSAGGLVLNNRVNGVLAVTRALGDSYMKDLVTGHPYTTETVIQPEEDEFIILACDGLWDVCTDQEAVDLIYNIQDPQAASKCLVDHALSRFSTDNLSVMVVRLDTKATKEALKRSLTPPTASEAESAGSKATANPNSSASSASPPSSPSTSPKRISEADRLVERVKKDNLAAAASGDSEEASAQLVSVAQAQDQEMGPEMSLPDDSVKKDDAANASESKPNSEPSPGRDDNSGARDRDKTSDPKKG
ncbi:hypothetical protein VTO42DRAFT_5286 [Malbranchea cinnamomea]